MTDLDNMPDHDIQSDGRTVWVHDKTGCTIARFGQLGIDIHQPGDVQLETGKVCLLCTHGPSTAADWDRFVAAMLELYKVEIGAEHRPTWLPPVEPLALAS